MASNHLSRLPHPTPTPPLNRSLAEDTREFLVQLHRFHHRPSFEIRMKGLDRPRGP